MPPDTIKASAGSDVVAMVSILPDNWFLRQFTASTKRLQSTVPRVTNTGYGIPVLLFRFAMPAWLNESQTTIVTNGGRTIHAYPRILTL